MDEFKPEGHNCVSVYLVSPDAEATIEFLQSVFDAEPGRIFRRETGAIMHGEVKIGDSVVMIGQPEGPSTATSMVHVYVSDPDAAYDRALVNGASSIHPVAQMPNDPDRRGGFNDPWGNAWFVARQAGQAGA